MKINRSLLLLVIAAGVPTQVWCPVEISEGQEGTGGRTGGDGQDLQEKVEDQARELRERLQNADTMIPNPKNMGTMVVNKTTGQTEVYNLTDLTDQVVAVAHSTGDAVKIKDAMRDDNERAMNRLMDDINSVAQSLKTIDVTSTDPASRQRVDNLMKQWKNSCDTLQRFVDYYSKQIGNDPSAQAAMKDTHNYLSEITSNYTVTAEKLINLRTQQDVVQFQKETGIDISSFVTNGNAEVVKSAISTAKDIQKNKDEYTLWKKIVRLFLADNDSWGLVKGDSEKIITFREASNEAKKIFEDPNREDEREFAKVLLKAQVEAYNNLPKELQRGVGHDLEFALRAAFPRYSVQAPEGYKMVPKSTNI